jgi:hypothetical protein
LSPNQRACHAGWLKIHTPVMNAVGHPLHPARSRGAKAGRLHLQTLWCMPQ